MHCKLKKYDIKQIDQRRPKSKIMNSRLFHLQGVGCKIVNCTQVAKKEKENWTNKMFTYINFFVLNDTQT